MFGAYCDPVMPRRDGPAAEGEVLLSKGFPLNKDVLRAVFSQSTWAGVNSPHVQIDVDYGNSCQEMPHFIYTLKTMEWFKKLGINFPKSSLNYRKDAGNWLNFYTVQ